MEILIILCEFNLTFFGALYLLDQMERAQKQSLINLFAISAGVALLGSIFWLDKFLAALAKLLEM